MRRLPALLLALLASPALALPPSAEFGDPYAIALSADGATVTLSGSFSWAVPQNFAAVLARAPDARTVRLDSPGGLLEAAETVAEAIRARGLDTFVPRLCASSCTVAFLGGRGRTLAPGARLGFHQAQAPGLPPAAFDDRLRAVYGAAGVPAGFVARVLRTPPDQAWFPALEELRAAGIVTGE